LLRRSLLNFCGGQMSHKKKQDGVGGDVQIEIDEAVHEEAGAGIKPETCKVPANELLSSRNLLRDSDNKTPRNQRSTGRRKSRLRERSDSHCGCG